MFGSTVSLASCTANDDNAIVVNKPTIARIQERGTILIGTTGDYRPLSFREEDGTYWGFGIEVAGVIADRLGVGIDAMICNMGQKKEHPYLDWVRDYVECFTKTAVCAPTPG